MFESIAHPPRTNWNLRFVFAALAVALVSGLVWLLRVTVMPLRSYSGPLPILSSEQARIQNQLTTDVKYLSETIGERNSSRHGSLQTAAQYLRESFQQAGYSVADRTYFVGNQQMHNLEVVIPGSDSAAKSIVVGAHYDSARSSPGANDNGTGVAAVLQLARLLQPNKLRKPVRLVLFVNEEPPYFQTGEMGSMVYVQQLRREHFTVSAMVSVETIGFYSDTSGSQKYPPLLNLFYPDRGNFIGFVGNSQSRDLVRRAVRIFRESAQFPSEGIAAPDSWPGIGWSDQWSFWQEGYPAIMITDTAVFRYPYYHTPYDTADHIDFERMARVVDGIRQVVVSLASDQD